MFSEALPADGAVVFAKACEMGLQGIVSKRAGSLYRSEAEPQLAEDQEPRFRADVTAGQRSRQEFRPADDARQHAAIADFTTAISLDPSGVRALMARADVYKEMENFPKAIEDYDAAIKLSQDDSDLYRERAYLFFKLVLNERAIEDATNALKFLRAPKPTGDALLDDLRPKIYTGHLSFIYNERGWAYSKQAKLIEHLAIIVQR